MIIRCSNLGKIMSNSRSKTDILSKTAKAEIRSLVKQEIFEYDTYLENKYLSKGIVCENDSIDLYNMVFFKNYEKNETRLTNDWITGECDILTEDTIIDIKSSWSKETFPATEDEIDNKDYEWQLRGYMWLYDKPFAELAYCFVETPEEFLTYEKNESIHRTAGTPPELRVTVKRFERDKELEEQIKERIEACRDYANDYRNQILNKNK